MKHFPFEREIYVVASEPAILARAIGEGARVVQLRDKNTPAHEVMSKAQEVMRLKDTYEFVFIVNDDPEIAVSVGADGVHIGQDFDTLRARRIAGEAMIIGKTTHNIEQARRAELDSADYISAGPVFATPTKPGRPPVGISYVREVARANLSIPFVAIGGIDATNVAEVVSAGARTIGIVRASRQIKDLLRAVRGEE